MHPLGLGHLASDFGLSSSPFSLVEIDFEVLGCPTGRDYVQPPVSIQICQPKILTRHAIIIDERFLPIGAVWSRWREHLDPNFAFPVLPAPTDNDLVPAKAQKIAASQGMPVGKRGIEHAPVPKRM